MQPTASSPPDPASQHDGSGRPFLPSHPGTSAPEIPPSPYPGQSLPEGPASLSGFFLPLIGVLALIAVGITVQSVMSPFVIGAVVVFLLYPWRSHTLISRVIVLTLLLVALWVFVSLFGILVPFLIAYLLAYLLNPLVTRLAKRGLPRWAGSLLLVVAFVGAFTGAMIYLFPVLLVQFEGILNVIRSLVSQVTAWLDSGAFATALESVGLPADSARQMLTTELVPRLEEVFKSVIDGVLGLLSGVTEIALQIVNVVIIPFLVFYILKDFPEIGERFYRIFSRDHKAPVRKIVDRIDGVLGRYFRGAVVVALIQGTLSMTVLWLIGVQYALVLGLMTSVLNFIPYVGLLVSLVVASLVALFSGGPVVPKVIGVVVLYLGQKLLEATVLGPKIIGPKVGLHPVVLILSLLVFAYFLGFLGMLIAVPATALLLTAWESWEERRDREA